MLPVRSSSIGKFQQLQADGNLAAVARKDGECRGMAAAGALAADGDAVAVDAQLPGVGVKPGERGVGILDGARKARLRSQPVIDGNDDAAEFGRQRTVRTVIDLQHAKHKAAAMQVEKGRTRRSLLPRRRIDQHPHIGRARQPGHEALLAMHGLLRGR